MLFGNFFPSSKESFLCDSLNARATHFVIKFANDLEFSAASDISTFRADMNC